MPMTVIGLFPPSIRGRSILSEIIPANFSEDGPPFPIHGAGADDGVPCAILRWLHIRTPVDVDNLKGYMKSQEQIHVSNLDQALPSLSTIDEALGEI